VVALLSLMPITKEGLQLLISAVAMTSSFSLQSKDAISSKLAAAISALMSHYCTVLRLSAFHAQQRNCTTD
jgi:hypothetical protein